MLGLHLFKQARAACPGWLQGESKHRLSNSTSCRRRGANLGKVPAQGWHLRQYAPADHRGNMPPRIIVRFCWGRSLAEAFWPSGAHFWPSGAHFWPSGAHFWPSGAQFLAAASVPQPAAQSRANGREPEVLQLVARLQCTDKTGRGLPIRASLALPFAGVGVVVGGCLPHAAA